MESGETIESSPEGKVKTLSEQLVSDPNSLLFASLADMYREEGMLEEALAMCQSGLALHPRHVPGRLVLAKIHRDAQQFTKAQEVLKEALSLDPGNAEAIALSEYLQKQTGEPPVETISRETETVSPPVTVIEPPEPKVEIEVQSAPERIAPSSLPKEELEIVPWAEAASAKEVHPSIEQGLTPSHALPEIERSVTQWVPGEVAQESFVISRPIDMEFPREEAPPITKIATSPVLPPSFPVPEEGPEPKMEEPERREEQEPPVKTIEVPAGVEVMLSQEPTVSAVEKEEKPTGEMPTIAFEPPLFEAPAAPLEALPRETGEEKARKEVPLGDFMKSLSETEFLKTAPSPISPIAEPEPPATGMLSDEMRAEMESALDDLLGLAEVEGAMIVNRDGLVMAERTRGGVNPEEAGALAASIFETACHSIERMRLGQLDRGIVETSSGRLYLTGMGESTVVLLTRDDTKMGLVLMRMKKVMERVRRVLG